MSNTLTPGYNIQGIDVTNDDVNLENVPHDNVTMDIFFSPEIGPNGHQPGKFELGSLLSF